MMKNVRTRMQQTVLDLFPEKGELNAEQVLTLLRNNLRPDIDFIYQSRQMGGRVERGGLVLDFSFINPPDLAINVQGVYYHYEQGSVNIAKDLIAREQLASQGVTLIFVDDIDLLENPDYFIKEALNYRDHSRIGAG